MARRARTGYIAAMKLSILHKLVLAILGLTLVVLIATLGLARWSFERGFLDYVNALEQVRLETLADSLKQDYRDGGNSWLALSGRAFKHRQREAFAETSLKSRLGRGAERDKMPPLGSRPPRRFPKGPETSLFNADGTLLYGPVIRDSKDNIVVPIVDKGEVIGQLRSIPHRAITSPQGTRFAQQQLYTSVAIGIAALLLAATVAIFLARIFLAPLRSIMANVNRLSNGDYSVRMQTSRSDELGLLIRDFDRLALTLDKNQSARKRWLADISHELRTPLTILNGEIEALKDGVRLFNSQQLESFDQEVQRLRHLVNDLYELSVSDIGGLRYSFEDVNIADCLAGAIEPLQQQAHTRGLQMIVSVEPSLTMRADRNRLEQLFRNLIKNSLAYTHCPGEIRIRVVPHAHGAQVIIEDSAPGASVDECQQLFDPLYRLEQSRNRDSAGAGLGLSICKNIVEAHGGTIRARPSDLGGVEIEVELPTGTNPSV